MKKALIIFIAALTALSIAGCTKTKPIADPDEIKNGYVTTYPTTTIVGEIISITGDEIVVGNMLAYFNEPYFEKKESSAFIQLSSGGGAVYLPLGLDEATQPHEPLPTIPADMTETIKIGENTTFGSLTGDDFKVGDVIRAKFDNETHIAEYINMYEDKGE